MHKNTLVRFAAREAGLDIEELLVGPTAIAFVGERPDGAPGDAVLVAKALRDFARTNPSLVVKGGVMDDRALSAADARALADVEPREVLLARLAGAFAAPMQQFAACSRPCPATSPTASRPHRPGRCAAAPADTNDTTEES